MAEIMTRAREKQLTELAESVSFDKVVLFFEEDDTIQEMVKMLLAKAKRYDEIHKDDWQWRREGWRTDEIVVFSRLGLVVEDLREE